MLERHNTYTINFYNRTDFNFKNVELTTCLIIDAALKQGIKAEFVLGKYLELSHNGKKRLFYISDSTALSYVAQRISTSKTETKDITKDFGDNYAIIEINNMPGIWPLHFPYIGKSRNAAGALIDLVFPETKSNT